MTLSNLQEVMESESSPPSSLHPTPSYPDPLPYTQSQPSYDNYGLLSPTSPRSYSSKNPLPSIAESQSTGSGIQNNSLHLKSTSNSHPMSMNSSSNVAIPFTLNCSAPSYNYPSMYSTPYPIPTTRILSQSAPVTPSGMVGISPRGNTQELYNSSNSRNSSLHFSGHRSGCFSSQGNENKDSHAITRGNGNGDGGGEFVLVGYNSTVNEKEKKKEENIGEEVKEEEKQENELHSPGRLNDIFVANVISRRIQVRTCSHIDDYLYYCK